MKRVRYCVIYLFFNGEIEKILRVYFILICKLILLEVFSCDKGFLCGKLKKWIFRFIFVYIFVVEIY